VLLVVFSFLFCSAVQSPLSPQVVTGNDSNHEPCHLIRSVFQATSTRIQNTRKSGGSEDYGEILLNDAAEFRGMLRFSESDFSYVSRKMNCQIVAPFKILWGKWRDRCTTVMRLPECVVMVHSKSIQVRWTNTHDIVPKTLLFGQNHGTESWNSEVLMSGDVLRFGEVCQVQFAFWEAHSIWSVCGAVDSQVLASNVSQMEERSTGIAQHNNIQVVQALGLDKVDWASKDVQHVPQCLGQHDEADNSTIIETLRKCLSRAVACQRRGKITILQRRIDAQPFAVRNTETSSHSFGSQLTKDVVEGRKRYGYWLVDFDSYDDYAQVFNCGPFILPSQRVNDVCVLVSEKKTQSRVHKDMAHAILYMTTGRKTFRFFATPQRNRPLDSAFDFRNLSGSAPKGWFDVVLVPGDALVVPPGVFHDVFSDEGTVAVSMVIDDDTDSASPMQLIPQVMQEYRGCDAVSTKLVAQPFGVLIVPHNNDLARAASKLRLSMFTAQMTLIPGFADHTGYEPLFGQLQNSDPSPKSGRVMINMEMLKHDSPFQSVWRAYQDTKAVATSCLSNFFGSDAFEDYIIDLGAIIFRPNYRTESQRLHFDAASTNRRGALLTMLLAINKHAGTVFVDVYGQREPESRPNFFHPELDQGMALVFDQTCTPHYGGPVVGADDSDVLSAVLFLRFRHASIAWNLADVEFTHLEPSLELDSQYRMPPMGYCARCDTVVHHTPDAKFCTKCFESGRDLRGSLLCGVCTTVTSDAKNFKVMHDLLKTDDTDPVLNHIFLSTTTTTTVNETIQVCYRFCAHDGSAVVDEPKTIWAYVTKQEVRHAIGWLKLFHDKVDVIGQSPPEIISACHDNNTAFVEFAKFYLSTRCPRASLLVKMALAAIHVSQITSSTGPDLAEDVLFLSTCNGQGNGCTQAKKKMLRLRKFMAAKKESTDFDESTTRILWRQFLEIVTSTGIETASVPHCQFNAQAHSECFCAKW
jgi:hypothetical protein